MADKKMCCSDRPPPNVFMKGHMARQQQPVVSHSGSISAFQPRSRSIFSGVAPISGWARPFMFNVGLLKWAFLGWQSFVRFSLQSDGSTHPIWFLLFSFRNKPCVPLTPGQFLLPGEPNLWHCISWSLGHRYYMSLLKEKWCQLNHGTLWTDRE